MIVDFFTPYHDLARCLLPKACGGNDDAHGLGHIQRVWKNAYKIQAVEGGNGTVLAAAVLLHDCVAVEKNSPLRAQSSRLAAERAAELLKDLCWEPSAIMATAHAIEAHSFSANIIPQTIEAKILRDADQLDAIGLIGIARCFYISGRLGRHLYDPEDPRALNRSLNDQIYTMDHFQTKLFHLVHSFQTETGSRLAKSRHEQLVKFFGEFMDEI